MTSTLTQIGTNSRRPAGVTACCLLTLCLLPASPSALAQDWPQWRGPARDGVVGAFEAPESWPEKLELEWKVEVGEGHSSPLVVDGNIYVHTREKESEVVRRLDLGSGKTLWRNTHPVSYTMDSAARNHGKGPKSTPVLYRDRLFTLSINGILSCYDAGTGQLVWRREFADRFKTTSPLFGTAMSPVVDEGHLVAHVGGHDAGALVALDVETGKTAWSLEIDGPGYASPVVVSVDGRRQVVTQSQEHLLAVDAGTGELLWKVPFETPYVQNVVTPLVRGDTVFFSGLENGTLAMSLRKKDGAARPETIWHNEEVSMYMSSPVLAGERLCGFSDRRGGQFFCLDAESGELAWASEGREGDQASVLVAGDLLFYLTDGAELIVVPAGGEKFTPVARYEVADSATWASPVILGREVLVKDARSLALWTLSPRKAGRGSDSSPDPGR